MSPFWQELLEILKYILPAIVVLIATSVIVKKFLIKETEQKRLSIFQENASKTMTLRLQAYERLSIFTERIHPRSLISRLYDSQYNCQQFHFILTQNIQQEFEHNLSQQIYVSNEVWKTVVAVKEQELAMINSIGSRMNPEAPAKEMVKKVMDYVSNEDTELPVTIALEMINNEAKMVLSSRA